MTAPACPAAAWTKGAGRRLRRPAAADPGGLHGDVPFATKSAPVKTGAEGDLRFAKVPPIVPVFVPAASQMRESACKLGYGK